MTLQFDLFDVTQNEILNATTYAEFKKRLAESNCQKCGLSRSRTHIVVDRGNPDSAIVMIGEGPGENEDRTGLAFVGRAGQTMDRLFKEELGVDTNRFCLIVNVVKCRPPENRAPQKEEAEACLPFLKKQIALMQPKVILLLGATALKHLVPSKSRHEFAMEKEAGKFFTLEDYPGIQWMVLYHPAFLLYDPRKEPVFRQHLQTLKAYLQKEKIIG